MVESGGDVVAQARMMPWINGSSAVVMLTFPFGSPYTVSRSAYRSYRSYCQPSTRRISALVSSGVFGTVRVVQSIVQIILVSPLRAGTGRVRIDPIFEVGDDFPPVQILVVKPLVFGLSTHQCIERLCRTGLDDIFGLIRILRRKCIDIESAFVIHAGHEKVAFKGQKITVVKHRCGFCIRGLLVFGYGLLKVFAIRNRVQQAWQLHAH